jgi:hypothetical protein
MRMVFLLRCRQGRIECKHSPVAAQRAVKGWSRHRALGFMAPFNSK